MTSFFNDSFNQVLVILLALVLIYLGYLFASAEGQEPTYAWGWTTSQGYFKIYYASMSQEQLQEFCPNFKVINGCAQFSNGVHMVGMVEGTEWDYTNLGCNTYTHEMLHHWGFKEQMIFDFFSCDHPSKYKSLPKTDFKT